MHCLQGDFSAAANRNSVFIFTDDLGYCDVGCYNPESKIPTPNQGRLAKKGIHFSDAHNSSIVCTPTRYSIITVCMAFHMGMLGMFCQRQSRGILLQGYSLRRV